MTSTDLRERIDVQPAGLDDEAPLEPSHIHIPRPSRRRSTALSRLPSSAEWASLYTKPPTELAAAS
jgi:hypothetical protein